MRQSPNVLELKLYGHSSFDATQYRILGNSPQRERRGLIASTLGQSGDQIERIEDLAGKSLNRRQYCCR